MLVLTLKEKEQATVFLEKHRLAIVTVDQVNKDKRSGILSIKTTTFDEKHTVRPGSKVFKQLTPDYHICFSIQKIAPGKMSLGIVSSDELRIYRNCLNKSNI